jgi:hypothetical protein
MKALNPPAWPPGPPGPAGGGCGPTPAAAPSRVWGDAAAEPQVPGDALAAEGVGVPLSNSSDMRGLSASDAASTCDLAPARAPELAV